MEIRDKESGPYEAALTYARMIGTRGHLHRSVASEEGSSRADCICGDNYSVGSYRLLCALVD